MNNFATMATGMELWNIPEYVKNVIRNYVDGIKASPDFCNFKIDLSPDTTNRRVMIDFRTIDRTQFMFSRIIDPLDLLIRNSTRPMGREVYLCPNTDIFLRIVITFMFIQQTIPALPESKPAARIEYVESVKRSRNEDIDVDKLFPEEKSVIGAIKSVILPWK